MAEPQKRKRIEVPKDLSKEARVVLATNVIDYIKERTEKSKDVDGKKFEPYSQSYINSPEFKIAGKSKNHVDLRLSNEMMESMELLDQGPGYIVIGYEEGTFANDKAVWNERSDNGPSRKFVGISDKDLEVQIAKARVETNETNVVASTLASRILKGFGL